MKKTNIINTQHPQWIKFWDSRIEFTKPTQEVTTHWPEIEEELLLEFPGYERGWFFIDAHGGQYYVTYQQDKYGSSIIGTLGAEPAYFETLEDAAKATFANWFPENGLGTWNDDGTELTVDGQWLVLESK